MRTVVLCAFVAVGIASLLPPEALKGASSGMLAFVGLLVAMLIPTMALNVTALRPRRGRKDSERAGAALMEQFDYWASMLWLSLVLAALLVLGSVLDWKGPEFQIVAASVTLKPKLIALVNVAIWFCSILLGAKLGGFVRGFKSLLRLHINQVLDEVQALDPADDKSRQEAIRDQADDPDFGRLLK